MGLMTSAILETLMAATDHFGSVLGRVEPDRYELATPCTEWSVVQLVDHVVVGSRWASRIVRGAEGRAALAQVLSAPLSDDRRVDWLTAGAEQFEAFAEPGALERTDDRTRCAPHYVLRKCRHSGPEPAASKPMLRSCRHSAGFGPFSDNLGGLSRMMPIKSSNDDNFGGHDR
jgi:hypothetical protein